MKKGKCDGAVMGLLAEETPRGLGLAEGRQGLCSAQPVTTTQPLLRRFWRSIAEIDPVKPKGLQRQVFQSVELAVGTNLD